MVFNELAILAIAITSTLDLVNLNTIVELPCHFLGYSSVSITHNDTFLYLLLCIECAKVQATTLLDSVNHSGWSQLN